MFPARITVATAAVAVLIEIAHLTITTGKLALINAVTRSL